MYWDKINIEIQAPLRVTVNEVLFIGMAPINQPLIYISATIATTWMVTLIP